MEDKSDGWNILQNIYFLLYIHIFRFTGESSLFLTSANCIFRISSCTLNRTNNRVNSKGNFHFSWINKIKPFFGGLVHIDSVSLILKTGSTLKCRNALCFDFHRPNSVMLFCSPLNVHFSTLKHLLLALVFQK